MISTSKKTALSWLRESWRQKKSKCGNGHSCPFVERKPDLFCRCSKTARNSMGPSAWLENILESRLISAQPGRKTEIEKRSWFGGPCFEGTLRKVATATFPNQIPWPG
jgi:hypothetical protein